MYETLLVILLLILFAILIIWLFIHFFGKYFTTDSNSHKKRAKNQVATLQKCPVCSSVLYKGETIISKIYRTNNQSDQLCHVVGCPHCYPECETGVKRICPVCQKRIPQQGYLIARIFFHPDRKNHVHIIGCTQCHIN